MRTIHSQICVNFRILRKMKMKWLKENGQDENEKLEHWKLVQTCPNKMTRVNRPSKFTSVKLGFFLSNSLKRDVT